MAGGLARWFRADEVGVVEIDPDAADTAALSAAYEVPLTSSANCVVVSGTRAGDERVAACVVRADTRADVNSLVKRLLDVRKASFHPMDRAVQETGMEYGGITPLGLPEEWRVLVDASVTGLEVAVIGSGVRRSKLLLPGAALGDLPGAEVVDGPGVLGSEVREEVADEPVGELPRGRAVRGHETDAGAPVEEVSGVEGALVGDPPQQLGPRHRHPVGHRCEQLVVGEAGPRPGVGQHRARLGAVAAHEPSRLLSTAQPLARSGTDQRQVAGAAPAGGEARRAPRRRRRRPGPSGGRW